MIISQINVWKYGRKSMNVTEKGMPILVRLFANLLWANSPKEWIIKDRYNGKTLFIFIAIPDLDKKIHRTFLLQDINKRSKDQDLWGLANDCIDEIKAEVQNY